MELDKKLNGKQIYRATKTLAVRKADHQGGVSFIQDKWERFMNKNRLQYKLI